MATTTNYSWTTPDDTALVKDGALAIRTLGSSVDTTVKNLNPETTTGAISYRGATANQKTALPIGTAGQLLRVNSGATAPEWATVASGGMTSLATGSLSGSAVTISTIDQTYNHLQLVIKGAYCSTADQSVRVRLNGNTGNVYTQVKVRSSNATPYAGTTNAYYLDDQAAGNANLAAGQLSVLNFYNYADTATRCVTDGTIYYVINAASQLTAVGLTGVFTVTDNIDSIEIAVTSGSFGAGSYTLYGVK